MISLFFRAQNDALANVGTALNSVQTKANKHYTHSQSISAGQTVTVNWNGSPVNGSSNSGYFFVAVLGQYNPVVLSYVGLVRAVSSGSTYLEQIQKIGGEGIGVFFSSSSHNLALRLTDSTIVTSIQVRAELNHQEMLHNVVNVPVLILKNWNTILSVLFCNTMEYPVVADV